MAPVRVASLAIVLMLASAGGSMAQMVVGPTPGESPGAFSPQGPVTLPGQGPGGFPGQGPGVSPGATPGVFPGRSAPQAPPCMAEFAPLRTETEKRAGSLKAAAAKRVPPQELCQLFVRFLEAEGKVVKFMEKNAASCGIPMQIVSNTKTNHLKSSETKEKVCAAASDAGKEQRRGPALGDALGVRALPAPDDMTTTGAGTLDSLSGNPLKR
jgi:hypothetical protein